MCESFYGAPDDTAAKQIKKKSLFFSFSPPLSDQLTVPNSIIIRSGDLRERERETTNEEWRWIYIPNQQRTLNKLPTELRSRNFVDKHRLGITNQPQTCKNLYAKYIFQLSFHFAYHRWWLGTLFHLMDVTPLKIPSCDYIKKEAFKIKKKTERNFM